MLVPTEPKLNSIVA